MDIFKIEEHFQSDNSISRTELIAHLNGLKNYRFSKKRKDLSGTFTKGEYFIKTDYSTFLRTSFDFQNEHLIGIKITPSILGYICLIAFLVGATNLLIKALMQTEFQHQLRLGITGLGFLVGFFIVRMVIKSQIKTVKKRLNL